MFRFQQRMLLGSAVFMNILMLIYLAYLQDQMYFISERKIKDCMNHSEQPMIKYKLTVVLREFEGFENDVKNMVDSFMDHFPVNVSFVIVSDTLPYPPIDLPPLDQVKLVSFETDITRQYVDMVLTQWINSEYVLVVPDGVTVGTSSANVLSDILRLAESQLNTNSVRMLAWPVSGAGNLQCFGLNVKLKQWTLQYYSTTTNNCDVLMGKFVLLMSRTDLIKLSSPFARPMHESIFIQTSARGWKVAVQQHQLWQTSVKLYENPHNSWKHRTLEQERRRKLFTQFGVKLLQKVDGEEEWFGCSKHTERCFGTIHNDMPDYIYKGRWTPPCCLQALRITARHVFRILDRQHIRYWLEGGSLLGAVRNSDIIPWDYDVDIGMYRDDISKSTHLVNCEEESYEDEDGFVWEKAPEGDFYRIQYSATNHLHVDIFPFFSHNGTMTKKTWFKTHRQDMPFPESFLKPLGKIDFVGIEAPAPNNAEAFLELKFGKGVVSNPRYPDSSKVVVPR
ncbi:hypothetical protein LSH36_147g03041 [Paralvinella palmiformis]|uniref:Fukutin-related protein n=1 Tax=Paralvinella palmiformis TaxID=53620 RepID=A0AAD9JWG4_9ANNE|nr:hypothetical protein LSH36_147g03041 [Paralvinella palmiformis]